MPRFLLKLFRRRHLERDLAAELAFHREMAAAHGNPIPMGNATVLQEQARDLWRFTSIENLWRDMVYAVRSLRRSPALVVTALLSLALGIGINTGIFSLAVQFLLSEPSISDPASVVSVIIGGNSHASKPVVDFVASSGLFQQVVGENEETFINFDDGADTRQIFAVQTTPNFFTALGSPMVYGRGYNPSDPGDVVVVSHHFWRNSLHGDPSVAGRTIRLDGRAYTVTGILPPDYRTLIGYGFAPDVFVPRYLSDTVLAIYARLQPGTTIGQARAGLLTIARRLDQVVPEGFHHRDGCSVTPVGGLARLESEQQVQILGLFFLFLLVLVGLVLLVACMNVASLLLARGSARRQELAIRLSLGAGRGRLFQQLLVESLLLAMAGATLGLLLHQALAFGLARLELPLPFPIRLHLQLDWRVTTYSILLTGFATLACGMLPAFRTIKRSIAPDLRRHGLRGQFALVAVQVALSVIVLSAGCLFLRNLLRAHSISPGFDVRHTLLANVNLPPAAYKDTQRKRAYVDESLRALSAVPGIGTAAAARVVPFTNNVDFDVSLTFTDTGRAIRARFNWNAVSPSYFRAMSIPIIRGQTFPAAEGQGPVHRVMVNRTFAERYLAGREPLGRAFHWTNNMTTYVVSGIVENTKNMTIGEDDHAQLYEDLSQIDNDRTLIQFVLKSGSPPGSELRAVHDALRRIEPNAGLEVATLYSSIGLAFLPSQAGAALLGSVGVLGLMLAAIGLYGVMVYSVTRRTREIGVRLALGAAHRDIATMILASAAKLIATGSAAGLVCAFFLVKPLAEFLVPGVHTSDPVTFLSVAILLAVTGFAAAYGPARRAAAVDPMTSLRYE